MPRKSPAEDRGIVLPTSITKVTCDYAHWYLYYRHSYPDPRRAKSARKDSRRQKGGRNRPPTRLQHGNLHGLAKSPGYSRGTQQHHHHHYARPGTRGVTHHHYHGSASLARSSRPQNDWYSDYRMVVRSTKEQAEEKEQRQATRSVSPVLSQQDQWTLTSEIIKTTTSLPAMGLLLSQ